MKSTRKLSETNISAAIAIETLSNVNAVGDIRQLILMLEPLLLGGTTSEKLAEGRKVWQLPPVESGEAVRIYTESADPWIRAVAVDAAGHLMAEEQAASSAGAGAAGENRSKWTSRINALAGDEDSYVREAAVSALGRVDNSGPREWLDAAAGDAEERVRRQGRRASGEEGKYDILSTIEKALFLKGVNLFESMTAEQLRILSDISTEIHIPSGKIIFDEGDPCDYLYVIVDGEVEITKDMGHEGEQILATLSPPSSFGEIALFGDEGRSAGARTGKDITLLGIEKDPLLTLIEAHPAISIAIIYELTSIVRNQDAVRTASTHQDGPDSPKED